MISSGRTLSAVLLGTLLLSAAGSSAAETAADPASSAATLETTLEYKCAKAQHWRDIAYLKTPMDRYEPFKNCIAWTAYQFNLPEELLYAVLYVERGEVNGKCTYNKNGTMDCGPAQINQVRMQELKRFDLSMADMRQNPSHNIWAMGYLLRREIEDAHGKIWQGVGNYHYHYSADRKIHQRYVNLVRKSWQRLNTLIEDSCGTLTTGSGAQSKAQPGGTNTSQKP